VEDGQAKISSYKAWRFFRGDGQAKSVKRKARDCRAMRRTYVRRSSDAIAATQQLASFCDAIKVEFGGKYGLL
jgi:hypothetical protein